MCFWSNVVSVGVGGWVGCFYAISSGLCGCGLCGSKDREQKWDMSAVDCISVGRRTRVDGMVVGCSLSKVCLGGKWTHPLNARPCWHSGRSYLPSFLCTPLAISFFFSQAFPSTWPCSLPIFLFGVHSSAFSTCPSLLLYVSFVPILVNWSFIAWVGVQAGAGVG